MKINIFWFRRDLRLFDNTGLFEALKADLPVLPIFIFDTEIIEKLDDKKDRRVAIIHFFLKNIKTELQKSGKDLLILCGKPANVFEKILSEYDVEAIFCNHDYEPYARERDAKIEKILLRRGINFHSFKDICVFEKNDVLKDDGKPYTVFTPYYKKRETLFRPTVLQHQASESLQGNFMTVLLPFHFPELSEIGFEKPENFSLPTYQIAEEFLKNYAQTRDFPALEGNSHLSVYLRFGLVSIRAIEREARLHSETFVRELVWREFFMMILWHFPRVVGHSFRSEYDRLAWRNDEKEFQQWCEGKTGYPIVDAGMRELNETGLMHNRVRMIVASFLVKHLLIDWRWGEAYFAQKLLDFDLSANNGGWQWAAGTGCDAAPYFRVFNPALQTEKFDKEKKYIRKWVKEYGTSAYPAPITEHSFARDRYLKACQKLSE